MQLHINHKFLGQNRSAENLHTPALIVHAEVCVSNSELMHRYCAEQHINLRPHTKTHRSVAIATAQMRAGAIGICTATLGEAEVMGNGGINSILITSPVVKPIDIERLFVLNKSIDELIVVVDNLENAIELEAQSSTLRQTLDVLMDLDPGMHRTGIEPGPKALKLAAYLHSATNLEFRGLQMYAGNLMHVHSFEERKQRSHQKLKQLASFRDELSQQGITSEILTGGGTGTFNIDPEMGVFTDLQAGSYLFMDRQYCEIEGLPFKPSLFVASSVISNNKPGMVTIDAGLKSFATDSREPVLYRGLDHEATYRFLGDEHGAMIFDPGFKQPPLGSVIQLLTPHCDPTFNLYDWVHVISRGNLLDIYSVDARGSSA